MCDSQLAQRGITCNNSQEIGDNLEEIIILDVYTESYCNPGENVITVNDGEI